MSVRRSRAARGANLVEYLMIVGAVALVCLGLVAAFGQSVAAKFRGETATIEGAGGEGAPGGNLPGVGGTASEPPSGAAGGGGDPIAAVVAARDEIRALGDQKRDLFEQARQIAMNGGDPAPVVAQRQAIDQQIAQAQQNLLEAMRANEAATQALERAREREVFGPDGPTTTQRIGNGLGATGAFVGGTAVGAGQGVVDSVVGLGHAVMHPIETGRAVVSVFTQPAPTKEEQRASEIQSLTEERDRRVDRAGAPIAGAFTDGRTVGQVVGTLASGEVLGGIGGVAGRVVGGAAEGATTAGRAEALAARAANTERLAARAEEGCPGGVCSRTFAPDGSTGGPSLAEKYRKQVTEMPDGRTFMGPESSVQGKAVNLTKDNGMVLQGKEGTFQVGVHATGDGLSFYADAGATESLGARAVAVRMYKNGYRGGDILLNACECGANVGLVNGLRKELQQLPLDTPVGTITAPTVPVNGYGQLAPGGEWRVFKP